MMPVNRFALGSLPEGEFFQFWTPPAFGEPLMADDLGAFDIDCGPDCAHSPAPSWGWRNAVGWEGEIR